MLGKPKFNYGDNVIFKLKEETLSGFIYIIDKYGTFEDPSDVSYDIMVENPKYISDINPKGECLYKHINEKFITKDE